MSKIMVVSSGLSYLNLFMTRPRPGIEDFVIQVETTGEKPTKLRIRGERNLHNRTLSVAKLIANKMHEKGDKQHTWSSADIEHLGTMLFGPVKLMSQNTSITEMKFVTNALK